MLSSDRIIVRRCFRATKQAFVFECLLVRFNGGGQIRQRLLRFGAEGEGRQCRLGGSLCRDSPLSIARILQEIERGALITVCYHNHFQYIILTLYFI